MLPKVVGEFVIDSFLYLVIIGILHTLFVLVSFLVLLPLVPDSGWGMFARRMRAVAFFNLSLLLWGCVGHYAWHLLTFETLYVSVDRLIDWVPFFPFGRWVIDRSFGVETGRLLNGATILQLQIVWAGVALPVWLLAWKGYYCIDAFWDRFWERERDPARQGRQDSFTT